MSWTSSSVCSPPFLSPALCRSCVCLMFLDCGGLLLYGRWIVCVDALWPLRKREGFHGKKPRTRSLPCLASPPPPTPTTKVFSFYSVKRPWESNDGKLWSAPETPQKGESNIQYIVLIGQCNHHRCKKYWPETWYASYESTHLIYACDKGHGWLFGRPNCMEGQTLTVWL